MLRAAPAASPLEAIPAFATLGAADHATLLRGAREIRVAGGRQIMTKGDPAESIAVLLSGQLRVSVVSLEGRAVTLRLVEPVDLVGEIGVLDGGPRTADVVALTASRLLLIPGETARAALRARPELAMAMLALLCQRLRDTSAGLERVAMQRLPARMAHLLLRLAADFGQPHPDGGITLPMRLSQTELGTLVAASREAVNKQLRLWREDALVEIAGGHIRLRRPAALAALLE